MNNIPNPYSTHEIAAAIGTYYAACGWHAVVELDGHAYRPGRADPRVTVTDRYESDESEPVQIVYVVRVVGTDVAIFVVDGPETVYHASVAPADVADPTRRYAVADACENGVAFD